MHILYIHQYFATPSGSTGTRSYEFAKRWVKAGHSVVMLTTTAQLTGEDLRDAKGIFVKRTLIDGITVRAVNLPYNQKMGFIKRGLSFIGFVLLGSSYVLCIKKPDVIYATSTPLTVGILPLLARWFRRIPFVFEVRDQWPEIPIELGIIRNTTLIRMLLWLEKTIYRNSSAIIALSPGQAEDIQKVWPGQMNIEIVPNSCDLELFRPDIDGSYIRDKYGWDERIVLLHAGAMGKVNSLHFVIDVAEKLKDYKDILFVLLGEGREKQSLEKRAAELNLDNVQILPSVPKHKLPKFFAAADVGLVIIGNYPIVQHNSANKFFDSLSAGKPVLLNYSGWQRDILEKANAGSGCELCNLNEFAANVLKLCEDNQLRSIMSNNARQLAEDQFNRETLAKRAWNQNVFVQAKF